MPLYRHVTNATTGEVERIAMTPAEETENAAAQLDLVDDVAEAETDITLRRDLVAIRTKAQAVFAGTDTFTAAQVQKLLAALVLRTR